MRYICYGYMRRMGISTKEASDGIAKAERKEAEPRRLVKKNNFAEMLGEDREERTLNIRKI